MFVKKYLLSFLLLTLLVMSCEKKSSKIEQKSIPFVWEGANMYFLLTDRFYNGDTTNDTNFERNSETGILRGFEGGDLAGVTKKIKEGYFNKLGINAIWMTPIVEQIHGGVDEGTGMTYGYHGYWAKDWTSLDPNFGTKEELKELVNTAHQHGIRIVLDAVINHRGPVTDKDNSWEEDWVRTNPKCTYKDYESTVTCTLVENLPDVKTESNQSVELPIELVKKWKREGRYEQEVSQLNAFFEKTGYPRAPRFYIMKWLADYITEFGIDGYRADTVKHTEEGVWKEFKTICEDAFQEWKRNNPSKVLDENKFFTVAEVYNYNISSAKAFDFGDKKVDYFENGFNSVINFEFKYNALKSYEELFSRYSLILNTELKGVSIMNYFTSHDDGSPFDKNREKNHDSAIKLLLTPGISQVYYGDESDRDLTIEGSVGDATLRSFMNWEQIEEDSITKEKLLHWQKLGQFRRDHPAIGAGVHKMLSEKPYVFSRYYSGNNFTDTVVVGLDMAKGKKELNVSAVFKDTTELRDMYSNTELVVIEGKVVLDTPFSIVMLEKK
jgi:alpha-amylase